jgi:hypothetical protein
MIFRPYLEMFMPMMGGTDMEIGLGTEGKAAAYLGDLLNVLGPTFAALD